MKFTYIDVKNEYDLEETARRLGAVLSVDFEEEVSGKYEEYPAYVAVTEEWIFALLGFPNPEQDLRDERDNSYYNLQVQPRGEQLPNAENIVTAINVSHALRCKVAD
jgi:hypothetical protein